MRAWVLDTYSELSRGDTMWIIQRLARVDDHAVEWQDTLWHDQEVLEGWSWQDQYNPNKIASACRFVAINLKREFPQESYRISWRDDEQDQ